MRTLQFLVLAFLLHGMPHLSEAQILEFFTDVQLSKGRLTTEKRLLIQINKKESDWISEVSIDYKNGDEVEILEASILSTDGKVLRKLNKKEVITRHNISNISLFEDDLVKEFTLRWNQLPYRIAFHTRVTTTQFVYLCHWTPLYLGQPTQNAQLQLRYPPDTPVRVYSDKAIPGDSVGSRGEVVRTWRYHQVAAPSREKMAPPIHERVPTVLASPKTIRYGVDGSLASWSDYGDWQDRLNRGSNDLPQQEKYAIDRAIRGSTDTITRIKKLYHYLQDNTRYINVSMDIGGLKSHPASYVSKLKYGDCKALTTYMKSLLGEIGVASYYANVNAGDSRARVFEEMPGPQFNHMILCVPLGKDTIWLENTSNWHPYNYLGTSTQREVLVINGPKSKLVRRPSLSSQQVLCRKFYDISLRPDGTGNSKARWELRGDEFEELRYSQRNEDESSLRSRVERALSSTGAQLKSFSLSQADRDSPQIDVALELEFSGQIREAGKSMILTPIPLALPITPSELEPVAKRSLPLRIHRPVMQEETVTYNLTFLPDYRVTLPQGGERKTAYGSYSIRFRQEGNSLQLHRRIEIYSGEIPVSGYSSFYAFLEGIEDIGRSSAIVLEPK